MEFPYGRQPHHRNEEHEEERREHQHHQHGFHPSPDFPPPPSAGEYYPSPGTQYDPGYYAPPPQPQPYSQVEHHAHRPFSQEEEYHAHRPFPQEEEHHARRPFSQEEEDRAHQGSGRVIHHESSNLFQRPECDTHSGSFPRPSYGPSNDSLPRPSYGPTGVQFPPPGHKPDLPRGQVVKVFCKADPNFNLAVRNGSVVMLHANPNDTSQQWVKDETYSTRVKDESSAPSFSLVNKATGLALKHGLGETQPVLLTEYRANTFDESILWTMSGEIRDGYRTIRLVDNINLNLDVFHGDHKSGGIRDGTPLVLWSWKKGDNQIWKIVPI